MRWRDAIGWWWFRVSAVFSSAGSQLSAVNLVGFRV